MKLLTDLLPRLAELAAQTQASNKQLLALEACIDDLDTQEIIESMQPTEGPPITVAAEAAIDALTDTQALLASISGIVRRRYHTIALRDIAGGADQSMN